MMKRVLLLIPEGLAFAMLTEEQQTAINLVFGQYVMPMPGTMAVDGLVVCDALTDGTFNPALMPGLGIDWEIISLVNWDEETVEHVVPLNTVEYEKRLAPHVELVNGGRTRSADTAT